MELRACYYSQGKCDSPKSKQGGFRGEAPPPPPPGD